MSGQGGVAVLISFAQVTLAVIGALGELPSTPGSGGGTGGGTGAGAEGGKPSTLAAVGLWALGSLGIGLCMLAFRFLRNHPTYTLITSQKTVASAILPSRRSSLDSDSGERLSPRYGDATTTDKDMNAGRGWLRTKRVLGKNRLLYAAVGLDFAVTLVSISWSCFSCQYYTMRLGCNMSCYSL